MADLAASIDLSRHGVIEAHAGTGKTYTIVELVLRILTSGMPVHVREIMLVTYTDKAAGELRARIRQGIASKIDDMKTARGGGEKTAAERHLEDCLNNLHEALIGTIHGVCHRLLCSYPFESGQHFRTEMVDDTAGLSDALRIAVRSFWREEESGIPWALSELELQGERVSGNDLDLIVETAKAALDPGSLICRQAAAGHTLATLQNALGECVREKNAALDDFRSTVAGVIPYFDAVLANPKGFKEDRPEFLKAIRNDWASAIQQEGIAGTVFVSRDKIGRKKLFTNDSKSNPHRNNLEAGMASVSGHPYVAAGLRHDELLSLVKLTLVCDAAERLRTDWSVMKRQQGKLSFQDMLVNMHRAVHDSEAFRTVLCTRVRYAIIDEFQDTSVLQWQIFKRLFLDNPAQDGPRLFIVGDPKQSIYSFMGADVTSYLAARAGIIAHEQGHALYRLNENFRSLRPVIDGYNEIITCPESGAEGWFSHSDITYAAGNKVQCPVRRDSAGSVAMPPWLEGALMRPVQAVVLTGSAAKRRRDFARQALTAITALRGREIVLPKGDSWQAPLKLDYGHFAVLVENGNLADSLIELLKATGIPCAKYKREGVFSSDMARHFRTLLAAVNDGDSAAHSAPRLALLLTLFFNVAPGDIDPDTALAPHQEISRCLETWAALARRRLWPMLFRSILSRTGVQERLMRLIDGDRHIADLRQVMDYTLELLVANGQTLPQVIEHLGNLEKGRETAGQDANMFAKETSKSCVQILTMHSAKGLEFPVTFLFTKGSTSGYNQKFLRWIDDQKRLVIMPYDSIGKEALKSNVGIASAVAVARAQARQERRRLLYVAMTRAQALCFVPLHGDSGENCEEDDLTPILHTLLGKSGVLERFPPAENLWEPLASNEKASVADNLGDVPDDPVLARKIDEEENAVRHSVDRLGLHSRACVQTSYTELSRSRDSDRDIDKTDESDEAQPAESQLPAGAHTGTALHEVLEECMGSESLHWADSASPVPLHIRQLVEERLVSRGVLKSLDSAGRLAAIDAAACMISRALSCRFDLPGKPGFAIRDLPLADRCAEAEFHLGVDRDSVLGYVDLLFRVNGRYYVLDWKSTSLPAYDKEHIEQNIADEQYDLQARIYSHALDRFLAGNRGTAYDPAMHLGGAVYIYLRAFENTAAAPVWTRMADPAADRDFVKTKLRQFTRGNEA